MTPNPKILLDFDGWKGSLEERQRRAIDSQLGVAPDRDAETRKIQNIFWIAGQQGVKPGQVNSIYDNALGAHAVRAGWGPILDTGAFNAKAREAALAMDQENTLVRGMDGDNEDARAARESSMLARAYWSAAERMTPAKTTAPRLPDDVLRFQEWQDEAKTKPGYNPKRAGEYWQQFRRVYATGKQDLEIASAAARRVIDKIGDGSEADISADGLKEILPQFRGMTPQQRALTFQQLGFQAKDSGLSGGVKLFGSERAGKATVVMQRAITAIEKNLGDFVLPFGARSDGAQWKGGEKVDARLFNQFAERFGGEPMSLDSFPELVATVTPEMAAFLNAKAAEGYQDREALDSLREIAQGKMLPIKKDGIVDYAVLGAAESLPTMALAGAGIPGLAVLFGSYAGSAERDLVEKGLTRQQAQSLAPTIGVAQAALDRVQLGFLKKMPGLDGILKRWSTSAAASFAGRVLGTTLVETGVELTQDVLAPAFVQEVGSWLDDNIPGVNAGKVWEDVVRAAPETFLSMLLLPILGAGRATWRDVQDARTVMNPDALAAYGLTEEEIQTVGVAVAKGTKEGVAAFREVWASRGNPAPAQASTVGTTDSAPQASEESSATPSTEESSAIEPTEDPPSLVDAEPEVPTSLRRDDDGWRVVFEDGREIRAGSIDAALHMQASLKRATSEREAAAMVGLADEIAGRSPNTEQTFSGDVVKVDEGKVSRIKLDGTTEAMTFEAATARNLDAQLRFLGSQSGIIQGSNMIRRDGVRLLVNNQSRDGMFTQAHEFAESNFREIMARDGGAMAVAAAKIAVGTRLFDNSPLKPKDRRSAEDVQFAQALHNIAAGMSSETEARETFSELAVADFVGRRKDGRYFAPGIIKDGVAEMLKGNLPDAMRKTLTGFMAMLKAVRAYVQGVFSIAAKLQRARREGTVVEGDALTKLLDEMLGVPEQRRHNEAVLEEVGASDSVTFSIKPAFRDEVTKDVPTSPAINGKPAAEIFADAKKRHGVTRSIYEAGYVLPDGTLLDFSGKSDAGYVRGPDNVFRPKSGSDYLRDQRGMDHREIEWKDMPDYSENWQAMTDFLSLGAIRIDANSGMISLHSRAMPTGAQQSVLKSLVVGADGAYLDLEDDGRERASLQLDGGKWPRVKGFLQKWANGETPEFTGQTFSIAKGGPRVTPAQDAEYMAAVESGDMATAQRMVDAAAKAAGYDSQKVTHITPNEFTTFDLSRFVSGDVVGFYFAGEAAGDAWADFTGGNRTIRAYLRITNPVRRNVGKMEGTPEQNRVKLQDQGYDGVIDDTYKGDQIIVFDPNQIKSADPITRDESGAVIPLSKRFDSSRDEITFSLADESALETIARRIEQATPVKPEARLASMAKAAENLKGIQRAWIYNDSVGIVSDAAKFAKLSAAYDAKEEALSSAQADESAAIDARIASEIDLARKDAEATESEMKQRQEFDEAAAQEDGWSKDRRDALHQRHRLELSSLREKSRQASREMKARHDSLREKAAAAQKDARATLAKEEPRLSNDKAASQAKEVTRSLVALDAILYAAPAEVRQKVGGFVALSRLTTDASRLRFLLSRADKMVVEYEKWLRNKYTAQLDSLIERALKKTDTPGEKAASKVGADAAHLLKKMDEARELDSVAISGRIADLETRINSGELTAEQEALALREIQLVQLAGDWKNADAAQMAAAYEAAKDTFGTGYIDWSKKVVAKREAREAAREALGADTGKDGSKTERAARAKHDLGWRGKVTQNVLNLSSFQEVNAYLFGMGSEQARAIVERELDASNAREDEMQEVQDAVEELFTSLAGSSYKGTELQWKLSQPSIETDQGPLSEFQAIQATLMWAQKDGQRHMEAFKYDQAFMDNLEAALSEEGKAVRKFLRERYAAEYAPLNALYRERFGANLPSHDNYAPVTVKPLMASGSEMVDPVTGVATTGSILSPGSLRTRSKSATAEPEFRDALQTYLSHTRQLAHWKAYYDLATDLQAIFGNRELGNKIEAAGGKEALDVLRKWKDYFSQGGNRDAGASLALNKMISNMGSRASQLLLFGKIGTLAIQSLQLGASAAEMPLGSYLKRLGMLTTGQLGWIDAIKSPYIQRRLAQAPPIIRQAMDAIAASKPNRIKAAAMAAGKLINAADSLFTAGSYAILLDYHQTQGAKLGLDGTELDAYAHRQAETATDRIAQPTRAGARSIMENTISNPLARVGWMFASEARQKLSLAGWGLVNWKTDPARAARVMLVAWGVGGLGAALVRAAMRDMRDDEDEELFDAKNWSAKRIAIQAGFGPLQGLPVVGELIESWAASAAKVYQPGGGIFDNASQAGRSVRDVIQMEADWKDIRSILWAAGLFNDTAAGAGVLLNAAESAESVMP